MGVCVCGCVGVCIGLCSEYKRIWMNNVRRIRAGISALR